MDSKFSKLIFTLLAVGLLLTLMMNSPSCLAQTDWSDNFNDGTFEPEWTIVNNTGLGCTWGFCGSNWTADNGYLEMLPSIANWGAISRSSDVVSGTWSFDIKFNVTNPYYDTMVGLAHFSFIGNDLHDLNNFAEVNTYQIQCMLVGSAPDYDIEFRLRKIIDGEKTTIDRYDAPLSVADWHHIDVTRTTTGLISVYHNHNCIPIMQVEDTDLNTSEALHLRFQAWQMIDNIVIDDEVLIPPCGIDPIIIAAAAVVVIVVVIILAYFLRRRR